MTAAFPRLGILLLATFAMGACLDSGGPLAAAPPGAIGGGGSGDSALVGEWSRTLLFTTDDGDIHMSRTIWSFDADGSAERWVIATSVAAGFADTVTAAALWDADGVRVTIEYQPPATGTVTFDYTVRSDTLTLGGDSFVRAD